MDLQQLILKLIPITKNEQKCALDKQLRTYMRSEALKYINQWYNSGAIGADKTKSDGKDNGSNPQGISTVLP